MNQPTVWRRAGVCIGRTESIRRGLGVILAAAVIWPAAAASAQTTDFSFAEPIVIELPNTQFPSDLAYGDLNGNGNIDLVVPGRNNDGIVHVLLGQGNGNFFAPSSFTVDAQTDHAVLADFNGNGMLDLALTLRSSMGRVAVLFGNGDGTFEDPTYYFVDRLSQAMAAADLNGNGHTDLVVANYRSSTIRVLLNEGDGTFDVREPVLLEEFVAGLSLPNRIAVGDINGNGSPDLAIPNLGSGRTVVLFNDGAGGFNVDRSYRIPPFNDSNFSAGMGVLGDVSGDGEQNLVTTMSAFATTDRMAVFPITPTGQLQPPVSFTGVDFGTAWAIALADFDGDGRLDVVISTGLQNQISFLKNVSDGGVADFLSPMSLSAAVGFAYNLYPLDINNNGVVDLVYPNIFDHTVRVLLNTTPQAAESSGRTTQSVQRPADATRGSEAARSDETTELRELLGITDEDSVQEILRKLEAIGDEPRRESR